LLPLAPPRAGRAPGCRCGEHRSSAKHHAAYVRGANDTLEQLAEAREKGDYSALGGLEKTLAFNLSGHVLHSIFWNSLLQSTNVRADYVTRLWDLVNWEDVQGRFESARKAGNTLLVAL